MYKKWFLPIFITILAAAGVGLEQYTVPNQEIVVQFAGNNVTTAATDDAIATIKTQLEAIGVDEVQVQETADGNLTISYYSTTDILSVRQLFSSEKHLAVGYVLFDSNTELPSEKTSNLYELDVYEIQNDSDFESDFDGHLLQIESKSQRFFIPDLYFSTFILDGKEKSAVENVAYSFQKKKALTIHTPEYEIPEVRAGPTA